MMTVAGQVKREGPPRVSKDEEVVGAWTHEGMIEQDGEESQASVKVLFDSGATTCAISKEACRRLSLKVERIRDGRTFHGIGGVVREIGQLVGPIKLRVGGFTTSLEGMSVFAQLPGETDVVLGYGRLRTMRVLRGGLVASLEAVDSPSEDRAISAVLGKANQGTSVGTVLDEHMLSVWLPEGERTSITREDLGVLLSGGIDPSLVDRLVEEINERAWREGVKFGMNVPPVRLKLKESSPPSRLVYPVRSPELIKIQREEIGRLVAGNLVREVPANQVREL
jgi:hypothetical protein